MAWIPVGFVLLAAAEVAAFVAVARAVGAGWAVLALLGASVVGLALLRREGLRGWRAVRAAAQTHQPPGRQVTDSLVGLLGALLLAVPGFVTAAVGLLLMLPPTRVLARRAVTAAMLRRVSGAVAGDLFGPRRVTVHRGEPVPRQAAAPLDPPVDGGVVEGEIVR